MAGLCIQAAAAAGQVRARARLHAQGSSVRLAVPTATCTCVRVCTCAAARTLCQHGVPAHASVFLPPARMRARLAVTGTTACWLPRQLAPAALPAATCHCRWCCRCTTASWRRWRRLTLRTAPPCGSPSAGWGCSCCWERTCVPGGQCLRVVQAPCLVLLWHAQDSCSWLSAAICCCTQVPEEAVELLVAAAFQDPSTHPPPASRIAGAPCTLPAPTRPSAPCMHAHARHPAHLHPACYRVCLAATRHAHATRARAHAQPNAQASCASCSC